MVPLALTLLLTTPGSGVTNLQEEGRRVLVLDLQVTNSDEGVASLVQDEIALALSARKDFKVFTSSDLKQVATLEVEKQTAGCEADESCLVEIAEALGAELLVFGNVGKLGELHVVNLTLYSPKAADTKVRINVKTRQLERLPDLLRAAIDEKLTGAKEAAPVEPSEDVPWLGISVVGGGALLALGGGLTMLAVDSAVVGNPEALTAEKDTAFVAEAVLLGAAVVGVVVVGVGVSLLAGGGD